MSLQAGLVDYRLTLDILRGMLRNHLQNRPVVIRSHLFCAHVLEVSHPKLLKRTAYESKVNDFKVKIPLPAGASATSDLVRQRKERTGLTIYEG